VCCDEYNCIASLSTRCEGRVGECACAVMSITALLHCNIGVNIYERVPMHLCELDLRAWVRVNTILTPCNCTLHSHQLQRC
jgi:hypothetical protein